MNGLLYRQVGVLAMLLCMVVSSQAATLIPSFELLNMREGPTLESRVVGVLEKDAQIRPLGDLNVDPFSFVLVERVPDGLRGYVKRRYLDIPMGTVVGNDQTQNQSDSLVDGVASMNIRALPDVSSQIVAVLLPGVDVNILGRQPQQGGGSDFCRVQRVVDQRQGFVKCLYLRPAESDSVTVVDLLTDLEDTASEGREAEAASDFAMTGTPAPLRSLELPALPQELTTQSETPESITQSKPQPHSETAFPQAPMDNRGSRWTVRLGAGTALSAVTKRELQARIANDGVPNLIQDYEHTRPMASLSLLYAFSPRWDLRAGYRWRDDNNGEVIAPANRYDDLVRSAQEHYAVVSSAWELGLEYRWLLRGAWAFSVDVGAVAAQDAEVDGQAGQPPIRLSAPNISWVAGTGLQFRLNQRWQLGARLGVSDVEGLLLDPELTLGIAY